MQNERWLDRLKSIECADATYPAREPALVFSKARGSLIYDIEGREYIDLCAGFGVAALGHNPPEILGVYHDRLGDCPAIVHGMGDVYPSRAKVELIETLVGVMPPWLATVSLSLTGGQAVETALKSAILATGQSGFIAFEGAYHGVDLGVLPVTSRPDFSRPFLGWQREDSVIRLPFGAPESLVTNAIRSLKQSNSGFAGIIVEPIQGRAGGRLPPSGWLKMLRTVCDSHQGLLIYDEVFTGLGRTGRMTFAFDNPCDLLCLGKALGGGLPLSACVGSTKAMAGWPQSTGEAMHTGTFFGHPMTCEVATLTLSAIVAQDLPGRSSRLGLAVRDRLCRSLGAQVVEVRGDGLMIAIELSRPGQGVKAMDRLRQLGVIALASGDQGRCLQITPALNIPEDLLELALSQVEQVIGEL